MSSLRNAVKGQKFHRERHQPAARQHLGLLEKHKDYKQRADAANRKKHQLRALKRKACNRNPDEFNFHMINSTAQEGSHRELLKEEDDQELPEEQVALLQTQDVRYIRHRRQLERLKLQKLSAQLHMLDTACNTHTFFTDTHREAEEMDVCKRLDTVPELLSRSSNRPRRHQLAELTQRVSSLSEDQIENMLKEKQLRYKELNKRLQRHKTLSLMQTRMEIKRHLMDKKCEKPKRIHPGSASAPPVYKWKMERKR